MGLAPSRQLYQDTGLQKTLPFISRPVEDYHYNSGEAPNAQQLAAALTAATRNANAGKRSGSISSPAAAVGTGQSTGAAGDNVSETGSTPRRTPANNTPSVTGSAASAGTGGTSTTTTTAAAMLKDNKAITTTVYNTAATLPINEEGMYYYYEHRLVPLTKEFFPSPESALFEQLWNARQLQNPRYHFELEHTWSPGSLLDPTACFDTFEEIAASAMLEEAVVLATKAGLAELASTPKGSGDTGDAATAKPYAEEEASCEAEVSNMELRDIPFATREELFDLLIRTTENDIMYESNLALRSAAAHIVEVTNREAQQHQQQHLQKEKNSKAIAGPKLGGSEILHGGERRIRPLPCAVVLVRTPVPYETYRNIYYVANSQRHHRMGAKAQAKKRKQAGYQQQGGDVGDMDVLEEAKEINIYNAEVLEAVREHESQRLRNLPTSAQAASPAYQTFSARHPNTTLTPEGPRSPWMTIRPKGAPLGGDMGDGPIELRVVGIYGCWTVQEILRRTLFSRVLATPAMQILTPEQRRRQQKAMDSVLQRATPYGVPSHTLVQVTFFERQVGDKEQSHTFFSLCRYFAHGLRYCLSLPVSGSLSKSGSMYESARSGSGATFGAGGAGGSGSGTQRAPFGWDAFVRALEQPITLETKQVAAGPAAKNSTAPPSPEAGATPAAAGADGAGSGSSNATSPGANAQVPRGPPSIVTSIPQAHSDLSTAIFIRFSNIPQLQLTRQIRIMAQELRASYPQPLQLVALQSAQRARTQALNPNSNANHNMNAHGNHNTNAGGGGGLSAATGVDANSEAPDTKDRASGGLEVQGAPAALRRKVSLSLDPDAISTSPHPTPTERLHNDGILCYVSNGLVVVRISHQLTVRSLFQMSYGQLEETIEAICVTLSTSSPPQMAYRGELRPAIHGGVSAALGMRPSAPGSNTTTNTSMASGSTQPASGGDTGTAGESNGDRASSNRYAWNPKSPAFLALLEESYYNSVRFLLDAEDGFPMVRYRCPFRSLEDLKKEKDAEEEAWHKERESGNSVPPENTANTEGTGESAGATGDQDQQQQQKEAKGADDSDNDNDAVDVFGAREGTRHTRYKIDKSVTLMTMPAHEIAVQLRSRVEREKGNYLPLHPAVSQVLDVYTVSAELDGKTMQYVFDQAAKKHYGMTFPSGMFSVGTPDSVLGWSPAADMKGRADGSPMHKLYGTPSTGTMGSSAGGSPMKRVDSITSSAATSLPLARIQDPQRILRAGDVIRFTPSASPTSTRTVSPGSVRRPGGRDNRRNPRELCAGTWYVDDSIHAEDLILSWMRRVSGRARESKSTDPKWLTYPPAIHSDMMGHALRMVETYPQCFIDDPMLASNANNNGAGGLHALLRNSSERQASAEMVKVKGFRQWRFSQDGFVYFHGVTAGGQHAMTLVEFLAESMGKRLTAVNKAKIDEEREHGLSAIKAEAQRARHFDKFVRPNATQGMPSGHSPMPHPQQYGAYGQGLAMGPQPQRYLQDATPPQQYQQQQQQMMMMPQGMSQQMYGQGMPMQPQPRVYMNDPAGAPLGPPSSHQPLYYQQQADGSFVAMYDRPQGIPMQPQHGYGPGPRMAMGGPQPSPPQQMMMMAPNSGMSPAPAFYNMDGSQMPPPQSFHMQSQGACMPTAGPSSGYAQPMHASQQQQQQQQQPPPPGIQPYTGPSNNWAMPALGNQAPPSHAPTSSGYGGSPQQQPPSQTPASAVNIPQPRYRQQQQQQQPPQQPPQQQQQQSAAPQPRLQPPQQLQPQQLQQQQQQRNWMEGSLHSQPSTPGYLQRTPGAGAGHMGGDGVSPYHEDADALVKPMDRVESTSFLDTTPSYGPAQLTEGFFEAGGSFSTSHRAGASTMAAGPGGGTRSPTSTTSRRGSLGYNALPSPSASQQGAQLPVPLRVQAPVHGDSSSGSAHPNPAAASTSSASRAAQNLRITSPGASVGGGNSLPVSPASPSTTVTQTLGTITGVEGGVTVQVRTRQRRDSIQQQRPLAPLGRATGTPQPAGSSPTTSPRLLSHHASFTQIPLPEEEAYGAQYGAMGISPGGGEETYLQPPPHSPSYSHSINNSSAGYPSYGNAGVHYPGVASSNAVDVLSNSGRQSSSAAHQQSQPQPTAQAPPAAPVRRLSQSGSMLRTGSGRQVTTHNPYYLPDRDGVGGAASTDSPSALSIRSRGQSFGNLRSPQQLSDHAASFAQAYSQHGTYGEEEEDDDGGFLASTGNGSTNDYYGGSGGPMYGGTAQNYYYSMKDDNGAGGGDAHPHYPQQQQQQQQQQGAYPNVPPISRWPEHNPYPNASGGNPPHHHGSTSTHPSSSNANHNNNQSTMSHTNQSLEFHPSQSNSMSHGSGQHSHQPYASAAYAHTGGSSRRGSGALNRSEEGDDAYYNQAITARPSDDRRPVPLHYQHEVQYEAYAYPPQDQTGEYDNGGEEYGDDEAMQTAAAASAPTPRGHADPNNLNRYNNPVSKKFYGNTSGHAYPPQTHHPAYQQQPPPPPQQQQQHYLPHIVGHGNQNGSGSTSQHQNSPLVKVAVAANPSITATAAPSPARHGSTGASSSSMRVTYVSSNNSQPQHVQDGAADGLHRPPLKAEERGGQVQVLREKEQQR